MSPLTVEERKRLRELEAKATAGRWSITREGDKWSVYSGEEELGLAVCAVEPSRPGYTHPADKADVECIAAARNALPALLDAADERDALAKEVELLRGAGAWSNDDIVQMERERDALRAELASCEEWATQVGRDLTEALGECVKLRERNRKLERVAEAARHDSWDGDPTLKVLLDALKESES